MHLPDAARATPLAFLAIASFLGLAVLVLLAEPLIGLPLRVPKDYNEGWNALHALRALAGLPLYPPPDALISNNYPPLGFYLQGSLGLVVGDVVIASRLLALFGLLASALLLAPIARRLGASPAGAALAPLLLLFHEAARHPGYVAMADPQWPAHALILAGLALILPEPRRRGRILAAACLMLAGGLIKHNPIALPLALTLWLLVHDRASFRVWLVTAFVLVLAALAGLYLLFGPDLFAGVLAAPRGYGLWRVRSMSRHVLLPMLPGGLLLLAVLAFDPRAPGLQLIGLHALLALGWAAVTLGGAGVDVNVAFELSIALALGAALALDRALALLAGRPAAGAALLAVALALAVGAGARLLPERVQALGQRLDGLEALRAASRADLDAIAGAEGPVLCEVLALCYWAGREMEVDLFNYGQKLRRGRVAPDALLARIEGGEFALIQLEDPDLPPRSGRLPEAFAEALAAAYAPLRQSPVSGLLLLPRVPVSSARDAAPWPRARAPTM